MFNGELNNNIKTHYIDRGSENISNNLDSTTKITICFKYNTAKKINGYEYKNLFFEITNIDERLENTFGVGSSFSATAESNSYNYYYTGKANFSSLFNHVNGLV